MRLRSLALGAAAVTFAAFSGTQAGAAAPEGAITPDLLSTAFGVPTAVAEEGVRSRRQTTLAAAVEKIERDMIQTALQRSSGNISETARVLGLTRRGLYLKMRRLGLEAAMADT